MEYPHMPQNQHAQVRIKILFATITISSENIADGVALAMKQVFNRIISLQDWQGIVNALDAVWLKYKR